MTSPALDSILVLRAALEKDVEEKIDALAIARKKLEAINQTIAIFKQTDSDILASCQANQTNGQQQPVDETLAPFPSNVVEKAVVEILQTKKHSDTNSILKLLERAGIGCGPSRLRTILATHPNITREGVRNNTVWIWKGDN